ncbi:RICIN domain-containing protein [Pilimelia columellifera]|uniref:Ricin B lectin domain-containing protein n=1 Tax=Pilimelia columellifera subsp. columellifera TaxID=706583 RepID=A0ABN3NHR1_9ACTN
MATQNPDRDATEPEIGDPGRPAADSASAASAATAEPPMPATATPVTSAVGSTPRLDATTPRPLDAPTEHSGLDGMPAGQSDAAGAGGTTPDGAPGITDTPSAPTVRASASVPDRDISDTAEIPKIVLPSPVAAAVPAAAEAPVIGRRRKATSRSTWLLSGVCALGLLGGVALVTGLVDLESAVDGGVAAEPAPPFAAEPTSSPAATPDTGRSASASPTPSRTASRSPSARPSPTSSPVPDRAQDEGDRIGALRSAATDMCLGETRGRQVTQRSCALDGSDPQWLLAREDSGFVAINRGTGQCLESPNRLDLATVALTRCSGDADQRWVASVAGNVFTLRNERTGKCLDVPAGTAIEGLRISQFRCNGSTAQNWELVVV